MDSHRRRSQPDGPTRPGRTRQGFTLVELLVVIAILALLAAILAPSLRRAAVLGRLAVCLSNQRQIGTAVVSYAAANSQYVSAWYDGLSDPYQTRTCATNRNDKKHNHYLLYERQHVDPRLFYCPLARHDWFTFEYNQDADGHWGRNPAATYLRVCYYLNPNKKTDANAYRYTRICDIPSDEILGMDHVDNSDMVSHVDPVGVGVLWGNGSAEFISNPAVHDLIAQHPYPNGIGSKWEVFFGLYDLLTP